VWHPLLDSIINATVDGWHVMGPDGYLAWQFRSDCVSCWNLYINLV